MNRPYKVCVDGKLWTEKLTAHFAQKVVSELQEKGLNATYYYAPERKGGL